MMLLRLYPYWRQSTRITIVGAILLIVAAVFELLQPWPVKWLVDSVFLNHPSPQWLSRLGLDGTTDKAQAVMTVCVAILVLALLHKGLLLVSQFLLIRAGNQTVQRLRSDVCRRLLQLSLTYHDQNKVGDSLYRIAYDTPAAQTLLTGAVVPM